MAEYIDKKALITGIQSAVSMVLQTAPYEKVWFDRLVDWLDEIVAFIERQPAAEVEPVRHGEWTKTEDGGIYCHRVRDCRSTDDFCSYGERKEGDAQ